MNKISKERYCIQSEKHAFHNTMGLCSLMENQSLVDIAICCGNNTLHAHKVVLAANSPLFREELEKNFCIEQVIVSGCDFIVMRSLIEFMYCGETIIPEDYMKYLIAAAKLFQMKILENLSVEDAYYKLGGETIELPKPQFLSKKPRYPAYPFNTSNPLISNNINSKPMGYGPAGRVPFKPHKVKRKCRMEAEHQACVKEAQASRMAIANLKKEIASAPMSNTFVIEETCTETTVENFIPHANEDVKTALAEVDGQKPLTADKIKHILGDEIPSNVEIMFKTNDGSFVSVTDEVLQNFSAKDGLQYQVVDEDGRLGELQELEVVEETPEESQAPLSTPCNGYFGSSLMNSLGVAPTFCNSSFSTEALLKQEKDEELLGLNRELEYREHLGPIDYSLDLTARNYIEEDLTPKDYSMRRTNNESLGLHSGEGFYDFLSGRNGCMGEKISNGVGLNINNNDKHNNEDDDMEIIVDDDRRENFQLSPYRTRSSLKLKFSPDMFFTNIAHDFNEAKRGDD